MKVTFDLEPYTVAKICEMLQSDYCKDRGFKMDESDLMNEAVINFYRYVNGILKD